MVYYHVDWEYAYEAGWTFAPLPGPSQFLPPFSPRRVGSFCDAGREAGSRKLVASDLMPSPIGHVIAGVAAGWLAAGVAPHPTFWRQAAVFGALGALPDVDLLLGGHRGPTHSLGAALLVGMTAFAIASALRLARPARLGLACAAAYASHVLLDWLGTDTSPPLGIMALWPFTRSYYESDLHVFMAISRRYYQGWTFVVHNIRAVGLELVILVPILVLTMVRRSRRPESEKVSAKV